MASKNKVGIDISAVVDTGDSAKQLAKLAKDLSTFEKNILATSTHLNKMEKSLLTVAKSTKGLQTFAKGLKDVGSSSKNLTAVNSGLDSSAERSMKAGRGFQELSKSVKKNSDSVKTLDETVKRSEGSAKKSISTTQKQVKEMKKSSQAVQKNEDSFKKADKTLKMVDKSQERLASQMPKVAQASSRVTKENQKLAKAYLKTANSALKMAKDAKKGGSSLFRILKAIKGTALFFNEVSEFFGRISAAMKNFGDALVESSTRVKKFRLATENIFAATSASVKDQANVMDFLRKVSKKTAESMTDLAFVMSRFTALGATAQRAGQLLIATLNIARETGVDLIEIGDAVRDVLDESTEALARYGFNVKKYLNKEALGTNSQVVRELVKAKGLLLELDKDSGGVFQRIRKRFERTRELFFDRINESPVIKEILEKWDRLLVRYQELDFDNLVTRLESAFEFGIDFTLRLIAAGQFFHQSLINAFQEFKEEFTDLKFSFIGKQLFGDPDAQDVIFKQSNAIDRSIGQFIKDISKEAQKQFKDADLGLADGSVEAQMALRALRDEVASTKAGFQVNTLELEKHYELLQKLEDAYAKQLPVQDTLIKKNLFIAGGGVILPGGEQIRPADSGNLKTINRGDPEPLTVKEFQSAAALVIKHNLLGDPKLRNFFLNSYGLRVNTGNSLIVAAKQLKSYDQFYQEVKARSAKAVKEFAESQATNAGMARDLNDSNHEHHEASRALLKIVDNTGFLQGILRKTLNLPDTFKDSVEDILRNSGDQAKALAVQIGPVLTDTVKELGLREATAERNRLARESKNKKDSDKRVRVLAETFSSRTDRLVEKIDQSEVADKVDDLKDEAFRSAVRDRNLQKLQFKGQQSAFQKIQSELGRIHAVNTQASIDNQLALQLSRNKLDIIGKSGKITADEIKTLEDLKLISVDTRGNIKESNLFSKEQVDLLRDASKLNESVTSKLRASIEERVDNVQDRILVQTKTVEKNAGIIDASLGKGFTSNIDTLNHLSDEEIEALKLLQGNTKDQSNQDKSQRESSLKVLTTIAGATLNLLGSLLPIAQYLARDDPRSLETLQKTFDAGGKLLSGLTTGAASGAIIGGPQGAGLGAALGLIGAGFGIYNDSLNAERAQAQERIKKERDRTKSVLEEAYKQAFVLEDRTVNRRELELLQAQFEKVYGGNERFSAETRYLGRLGFQDKFRFKVTEKTILPSDVDNLVEGRNFFYRQLRESGIPDDVARETAIKLFNDVLKDFKTREEFEENVRKFQEVINKQVEKVNLLSPLERSANRVVSANRFQGFDDADIISNIISEIQSTDPETFKRGLGVYSYFFGSPEAQLDFQERIRKNSESLNRNLEEITRVDNFVKDAVNTAARSQQISLVQVRKLVEQYEDDYVGTIRNYGDLDRVLGEIRSSDAYTEVEQELRILAAFREFSATLYDQRAELEAAQRTLRDSPPGGFATDEFRKLAEEQGLHREIRLRLNPATFEETLNLSQLRPDLVKIVEETLEGELTPERIRGLLRGSSNLQRLEDETGYSISQIEAVNPGTVQRLVEDDGEPRDRTRETETLINQINSLVDFSEGIRKVNENLLNMPEHMAKSQAEIDEQFQKEMIQLLGRGNKLVGVGNQYIQNHILSDKEIARRTQELMKRGVNRTIAENRELESLQAARDINSDNLSIDIAARQLNLADGTKISLDSLGQITVLDSKGRTVQVDTTNELINELIRITANRNDGGGFFGFLKGVTDFFTGGLFPGLDKFFGGAFGKIGAGISKGLDAIGKVVGKVNEGSELIVGLLRAFDDFRDPRKNPFTRGVFSVIDTFNDVFGAEPKVTVANPEEIADALSSSFVEQQKLEEEPVINRFRNILNQRENDDYISARDAFFNENQNNRDEIRLLIQIGDQRLSDILLDLQESGYQRVEA